MAQKELWNIAKKENVKEKGDLVCEHQAMHEENFLGSWLREDVEGK